MEGEQEILLLERSLIAFHFEMSKLKNVKQIDLNTQIRLY